MFFKEYDKMCKNYDKIWMGGEFVTYKFVTYPFVTYKYVTYEFVTYKFVKVTNSYQGIADV